MNLYRQISLFCAVKEGRIDIAQHLLDRGTDPGKLLTLLLNAGAETHVVSMSNIADQLNISGWTSLYAAMKSQEFNVVKLLLRHEGVGGYTLPILHAHPNKCTKS
ncbi:unnamed protein product [Rotaria sp. Silwood2]|nr:unnamed protein product [Rotaria sp. Silwood2]